MRIAVVGSGLMGVTSAYFLAQDGHAVTVLDRAHDVAQGASHANAGMLTPSMADPWNAPGLFWHLLHWLGREEAPLLLRPRALPSLLGWGLAFLANSTRTKFRVNMEKNLVLADYSLRVMQELRERLGLRYQQSAAGTLKVFRNTRSYEAAAQRSAMLATLGLRVQELSRAGTIALEPSLADVAESLVGSLHYPDDQSGDARLFTVALAGHARSAGVQFRFGENVSGFECEARRITALRTTAGPVSADAYVLAAGSWTPLLLRGLGLRIPVQPVKGYSITLDLGNWSNPPRRPIIDDALHAAATPLGTRLRVAGTAELAGYDDRLTPARVDNLFDLLLSMFPSFAPHLDRSQTAPWCGFRPMSADGVPFIGRLGFDNLYVNTGHGHLGWTLAAGSARMLGDLISGKPPAINADAYAAMR